MKTAVNEPSQDDLDVLKQLESGADPSQVPPDAVDRLIGFRLLAHRPPGRIILTGTAKDYLLRHQYGLPLPAVHEPEATEPPETESPDQEAEPEDEAG
jgi:hypothetical protein